MGKQARLNSWVKSLPPPPPSTDRGSVFPKPFLTGSLSPALPFQPGLGRVLDLLASHRQEQVLCHCFSRPTEGSHMDALRLSRICSELSSPCLQQLPGQRPGFCLLLSDRHSLSSRLGHFLKTLRSWLSVLASCFRLRCLAQPRPVKWPSQL